MEEMRFEVNGYVQVHDGRLSINQVATFGLTGVSGVTRPDPKMVRLGQHSANDVWRHLLRMANAGQISFDDTGRIASLATPVPAAPTSQEPTR